MSCLEQSQGCDKHKELWPSFSLSSHNEPKPSDRSWQFEIQLLIGVLFFGCFFFPLDPFSLVNTSRQNPKCGSHPCLVLQLCWSGRSEIIEPKERLQAQRRLNLFIYLVWFVRFAKRIWSKVLVRFQLCFPFSVWLLGLA